MAKAETWKQRVREWKQSGLTARQFADAHGLQAASLYFWSSRLQRDSVQALPAAPRFVALRTLSSELASSTTGCELHVRPGLRISIAADIDRVLLRDLLDLLLERS